MKTYKTELSTEPLREGCLTQYGVVTEKVDEEYTVNDFESFNEMDLKHLKCYERRDHPFENTYDLTQITNPQQLQKIWEAIRGEEPKQLLRCNKCIGMNSSDCSTCYGSSEVVNTNYYGNLNEWQNFTLKEGTYQVDIDDILPEGVTCMNELMHGEVLPNNNGWISVEERLPNKMNPVIFYGQTTDSLPKTMHVGVMAGDEVLNSWLVLGHKMYKVTHWQPLPQPPRL